MPLDAGQKLAHYEVIDLIGKGGMGEVYRAKDSKLGRDVAIKVLPDELAQDEERLARFEREAKVLASLNHPSIASIYGLEEFEGTRFLVLELVEGETLEERIKRGPVPIEETLKIAGKIAVALEEAHERAVVHRDLKPANVKLTPDDDVKVLDFGLAKAFAEEGSEADAASSMSPTVTKAGTQLGVILGTAAYMSPEQAKGKNVDRRTDVFAFGSVLYEMLTGRKAFEGDVVSEVIVSVLAREPDMSRLPTNLHPRIRELVTRCLEKDPKRRWQAVGDLRLEIDSVLEDPDRGLAPVAATHRFGVRGHVAWALAALATGVLAAVVTMTLAPTPERPLRRFVLEPQPGQKIASNPLPGNEVAFAPDGSILVYAAVEEGGQELFLRPMDAFQAEAIPGTLGAYSPFFSPDGQWLGFFVESVLYKVQIPDGTPLRVQDMELANLAGGSWGEDDKIIVGRRTLGLARVSASGGHVEVLNQPDTDAGESNYLWPHLLPGERAVVFTVLHGFNLQNARLAVLFLDTAERRMLSDEEGYAAQYTESGHLVYGRAGVVMAAPFDHEQPAITGTPVQMLRNVFTKQSGAQSIAVSEDGSLAFIPTGGSESRRLVWVDRRGNKTPVDGLPAHAYEAARLSPKGNQLAVAVRGNDGAGSNILVYDFEQKSLVGFGPAGSGTSPLWTPDGERITFRSADGSIRWKSADGSGTAETLFAETHRGRLEPVAWSPDGSTLLLYDELGITLLEDGTRRDLFLAAAAFELAQAYAPDGRYVAYISSESGRPEVYVNTVPDPQQGRWQISTDGGYEAMFSPGGDELFYRGPEHMVAVRVELDPTVVLGQRAELFPDSFFRHAWVRAFDYDADEDRFLMIEIPEDALRPRIHVVLNWTEELERLVPTP